MDELLDLDLLIRLNSVANLIDLSFTCEELEPFGVLDIENLFLKWIESNFELMRCLVVCHFGGADETATDDLFIIVLTDNTSSVETVVTGVQVQTLNSDRAIFIWLHALDHQCLL